MQLVADPESVGAAAPQATTGTGARARGGLGGGATPEPAMQVDEAGRAALHFEGFCDEAARLKIGTGAASPAV